jgi:energy-coupling factor transporter ATP-binding protein EcfA2
MIELRELGYAYPGGHEVLRGVTFNLRKGGRLGLLGRNGSGKTTLARLLCCLQVPTSGTASVDGLLTSEEKSVYEVRRKVGLVFQDPEQQIVETTVERELGFGPRNLGLAPAEVASRVENALHLFGIEHLRKRPCHLLSAGEKQLAAVASVFTMRPDYIVLDEPTALLDPSARRTFLFALDALLTETGAGVLFISMRLEDLWLSDEVMFLSDGRIDFKGGRDALLRHMRKVGFPLHGLGLLASEAQARVEGLARISECCKELSPGCLAGVLASALGSNGADCSGL